MGKLERVQVEAGEDGEDSVEAGYFVDDKGKCNELGRGAEGDEVEEGLRCDMLVLLI